MKFECKQCAGCCKFLNIFANIDDIDRWLDDGKNEIISCLTWQLIAGRNPPQMIMIPKKHHIKGHKYLGKYFKEEWKEKNECLFLDGNKCNIYDHRPSSCVNFPRGKVSFPCPGITDKTILDKTGETILTKRRKEQNLNIYKNRETISKLINTSKELVDQEKLKKILWGEQYEQKTTED